MSKALQKFSKSNGILYSQNPLYHPQCNGQAEQFIQSIKKAVRKKLVERNAKLDVVDQSLSVYRNTCRQETPAKLLLGWHLPCSLDLLPSSPIGSLETSLKRKVQSDKHNRKSLMIVGQDLENHFKLEMLFYFNNKKVKKKRNRRQLVIIL